MIPSEENISVASLTSRKGLSVVLSQLEGFSTPDVGAEQYASDSETAADLLWQAYMSGDLKDKRVIDLGAGTGILSVGAALLGARVTAVERDENALLVLKRNIQAAQVHVHVRPLDVRELVTEADTVLMNPPFGTKDLHADRVFIARAAAIAETIYTIHKTTTKRFILAYCQKLGLRITWERDRQLLLGRTQAYHRQDRQRISVTLYCLRKAERDGSPTSSSRG